LLPSTGAALLPALAIAGAFRHDEAVPQTIPEACMSTLLRMWQDDQGQDIAEYAVMLAVILVIVVGTVKLIGGKSNNIFSEVASSIQ
jgi:Flp pilus assembly pilin Flp